MHMCAWLKVVRRARHDKTDKKVRATKCSVCRIYCCEEDSCIPAVVVEFQASEAPKYFLPTHKEFGHRPAVTDRPCSLQNGLQWHASKDIFHQYPSRTGTFACCFAFPRGDAILAFSDFWHRSSRDQTWTATLSSTQSTYVTFCLRRWLIGRVALLDDDEDEFGFNCTAIWFDTTGYSVLMGPSSWWIGSGWSKASSVTTQDCVPSSTIKSIVGRTVLWPVRSAQDQLWYFLE